ncbi:MAG: ribosome small subunit-dependent GTPase A [Candidatus Brocadiia bacterium]
MSIEKIGFNDWFREQAGKQSIDAGSLARVSAEFKERYFVHTGNQEIRAEISGRFSKSVEVPGDYPAVGDWVAVTYYDKNTFAVINKLLPRKNVLRRRKPGKKLEYQTLAANIDTAFIVQGVDNDFNLNRLERYLIMFLNEGIEPAVILNKIDLVNQGQLAEKITAISNLWPYPVWPLSSLAGDGVNEFSGALEPGKTYCLMGSSGVGKSSLLNRLSGDKLNLAVNEVRKDGRGKHTTTERQLFVMKNGSIFIDNPGLREIGIIETGQGMQNAFHDITRISDKCKFRDCTHTSEPGCAVIKSFEDGAIGQKHLDNYYKLRKEADYYSQSYAEKRKKDKKFGVYLKKSLNELYKHKGKY